MKTLKVVVVAMAMICGSSPALISEEAASSPLIGTWKMKEKIGSSWFTDYITITSVDGKGYIKGRNEYGTPLAGYAANGVAFVTISYADYYCDSYYWNYTQPSAFAKHMGVYSYLYDFQSAWHVMFAAKNSSTPAALTPDSAAQVEEERWKAEEDGRRCD